MDSRKYDICVLCEHARMRTDICGIYCVGSYFKREDGSCDYFKEHKKRRNKRNEKCDKE